MLQFLKIAERTQFSELRARKPNEPHLRGRPKLWAWPLRASRFYRLGVLGLGSALVAALAAVWLVERAFALRILPFTV